MTAIVGIFDGERTWMAADGRTMAGEVVISESTSKILSRGPWLVAVSGDLRASLAIATLSIEPGASSADLSLQIREAVTARGWRADEHDEPNWRYEVLLGAEAGLYHHCCMGSVLAIERLRPFGMGSGGCYAEAAAWEALRHGLRPEQAVISGIRAAMAYVPSCGGEITVACSEPKAAPPADLPRPGGIPGQRS